MLDLNIYFLNYVNCTVYAIKPKVRQFKKNTLSFSSFEKKPKISTKITKN